MLKHLLNQISLIRGIYVLIYWCFSPHEAPSTQKGVRRGLFLEISLWGLKPHFFFFFLLSQGTRVHLCFFIWRFVCLFVLFIVTIYFFLRHRLAWNWLGSLGFSRISDNPPASDLGLRVGIIGRHHATDSWTLFIVSHFVTDSLYAVCAGLQCDLSASAGTVLVFLLLQHTW